MKEFCLRWGMFGAGRCTHDFVSALKLLPRKEHEVVAIASRNSDKAEQFAKTLGVTRFYGSYLELAQASDIDIIYIGTVNSEHFMQAKTALMNGKHVLCEKPICINSDQVKELLRLAKEKGLFLMEGFWTFFFPATKALFREISHGGIGQVLHMTLEIGNKFYHLERFSRKEIGGGCLLNHGVYGLMYSYLIFGKPTSVKASGIISPTGTDESVAINLKYDNSLVTIVCSCKADMPGELRVIGSEGTLKLPFPFWAPTILESPSGKVEMSLPETPDEIRFNNLNSSGFVYEAEHVRQCIMEGRKESTVLKWEASIAVMEIADEVRRQIGLLFDNESLVDANGNSSFWDVANSIKTDKLGDPLSINL